MTRPRDRKISRTVSADRGNGPSIPGARACHQTGDEASDGPHAFDTLQVNLGGFVCDRHVCGRTLAVWVGPVGPKPMQGAGRSHRARRDLLTCGIARSARAETSEHMSMHSEHAAGGHSTAHCNGSHTCAASLPDHAQTGHTPPDVGREKQPKRAAGQAVNGRCGVARVTARAVHTGPARSRAVRASPCAALRCHLTGYRLRHSAAACRG